MRVLHILIDDLRNLEGMDIVIRTPHAAMGFTEWFDSTGHCLYMDNDLAYCGWEGHHILSRILELGQRPAKVVLVTANPVAAERMRADLIYHGYTAQPNRVEFDFK